MAYHEYIGNLHMHTPYSDGEAWHSEIADAAISTKLDFVIVTDHNIWVDGVQGYYGDEKRGYVLLLTGQEIHDRTRLPQVNHCLVYNAKAEMNRYAPDPQALIKAVNRAGGMTFLAHPFDKGVDWREDVEGIPWVDWDIEGYTGLEIWNYMSSFKAVLENPVKSLRRLFSPEDAIIGPDEETLAKWDQLLAQGKRVVGIGNSDAHGTPMKIGPLTHIVFPYDFLFNCVNTHILTQHPLIGEMEHDADIIYRALARGSTFISYRIPGEAKGFRYSAQGGQGASAQMGDTIRLGHGVTLQVLMPIRTHIKMIFRGQVVADETNVENLTYVASQPGAYRVEVWREYKGIERCWILSNPIYVEPNIAPIGVSGS